MSQGIEETKAEIARMIESLDKIRAITEFAESVLIKMCDDPRIRDDLLTLRIGIKRINDDMYDKHARAMLASHSQ